MERNHQVLNMGANEEKETQTEIMPPLPHSTGISISLDLYLCNYV